MDTQIDAVCALSRAIVEAGNSKEVYSLILDTVVRLLGVEKASIMIFDPNEGILRIAAAKGMDEDLVKNVVVRVGEGISGKVFSSHSPVLMKDIEGSEAGPGKGRYKTRSLISAPVTCFPLKVGGDALGVINVTDRTDGRQFDENDLKLLTTISNQAASYIHILKLMENVKTSERMREQLEIARQIQYKLLPSDPPRIEGLDVAGRLITAERVGGDYYDIFLTHVKKPSFVIADVSGHSVGAAMIMAAFRAAVRAQRDADYSPALLVQRINSILYEDLYQSEQFISMIYLQYLKSRQLINYTTAGHSPPIVWRGANNKFEGQGSEDPLLGIESKAVFHEKQMVVSKGDVIVLYTDGITESANREGVRFGKDRLLECLSDALVGSARQIADVVAESVRAFIDPAPLKDDLTVLVMKIV